VADKAIVRFPAMGGERSWAGEPR